MEIVKIQQISKQLRRREYKKNEVLNLIADLKPGEALVLSAKEADKWKYPSHALRSNIMYGYKKNLLSRTVKYSVNLLKSGSYAVIRNSK